MQLIKVSDIFLAKT